MDRRRNGNNECAFFMAVSLLTQNHSLRLCSAQMYADACRNFFFIFFIIPGRGIECMGRVDGRRCG